MKIAQIIALGALASGCMGQSSLTSTIITPAEFGEVSPFSEAELKEPVAVRNLRTTPEATFQVVRLRERVTSRVHQNSDVVLMVVSGRVQVGVGKDSFRLSTGNVLELPRGVVYEITNRASDASMVYVVYTPALGADDVKPVSEPPKDSSWKWNLWTQ